MNRGEVAASPLIFDSVGGSHISPTADIPGECHGCLQLLNCRNGTIAAAGSVDLQMGQPYTVPLQHRQDIVQLAACLIFYAHRLPGGITQTPIFKAGQQQLRCQQQNRGIDTALIKPRAKSQTNNGRNPQPGSRCKPLHLMTTGNHNGPGAYKADASNYLCSQPGNIRVVMHSQQQILAGHCGDARAQTNQDMRPESGGPAAEFSLKPNDPARRSRQQHPQHHGPVGQITDRVQKGQHEYHLLTSR